jgi:hypothetical protein
VHHDVGVVFLRRPSSVVSRPSSVVRRPSSVVRRPSSVVCRPSPFVRRLSSVVRRPSSVVLRPSSVVRPPSPTIGSPTIGSKRRHKTLTTPETINVSKNRFLCKGSISVRLIFSPLNPPEHAKLRSVHGSPAAHIRNGCIVSIEWRGVEGGLEKP